MGKKSLADDTGEVRFKPRPTSVLLEVSSDWIKLLEVASQRSGISIEKAYLERVDADTVIADRLQEAFKTGKFSHIPILCSIPRQSVNVRLLELPSVDPAEIKDMVELQVSRQTPYSVQEILSGFKIVGHTRQATYTRVLLAIVQRSVVRERYYAVENAGLSVDRMGVSSEGVQAWLLSHTQSLPADKVILSLDVDSYFTHMLVVHRRKVIFTKSLLWGAKQSAAGVEAFVQRVQEASRACEDVLQGQKFDVVLVSGATAAHSTEMVQALQAALDVPCKSVDPLQDVGMSPAAGGALTEEARAQVSLTGLVGMALVPDQLALHFEPDVYAMRQRLLWVGRAWSGLISSLAALLVAGSLYFTLAAWSRVQQLQDLQINNALLQPQVREVDRMVEVIRATRSRQEAQLMPEHLLPIIHGAVPDGVYLGSLVLQMENGRISIQGSAPQRRDIRELIRRLEESPYFVGLEEAGGTTMDNTQRFRFQINGEITGGGQS